MRLGEIRLPALKKDREGRARVDFVAVIALAVPLFLDYGVQALLNLTDTWFIGRISTNAIAAMGAVYFPVILFVLLLGGVGLSVQTIVAQAYGSGRRADAAEACWAGCWSTLLTVPPFVMIAVAGDWILAPFQLPQEIHQLAVAFWLPRMLGGPFAVLFWVLTSFFNGIGRTGVTLAIMVATALLNAGLNQLFIFELGLGMAGAAWATTLSLFAGACLTMIVFLSRRTRSEYRSHHVWRPRGHVIAMVLKLGLPMGLFPAVDLLAISLFQLMQARLGPLDGAATQIVMMLTSIAYMPAIGIAIAGTTLVGQSIGAGDKDWAMRVGNATIGLAVGYMGTVGVLLALSGPWLIPLFVSQADPRALEVAKLGTTLLWIAMAYQVFDGLNLGSAFCLRGAADVKVPTMLLIVLSWLLFVPLAHSLSFKYGEGWFEFLPQYGLGAVGGWTAILVYVVALGVTLFLRWRSGAWRHIVLHSGAGVRD